MSRVFEALRKSAKFTAAQNKEERGNYADCVGELVAMCEKQGFIPRFATDIPQDKVDFTLKDMNEYIYNLVTKDLGFGQQIEDSLRKIQLQKEAEKDTDEAFERKITELEDEDFAEYIEDVEELTREEDNI